MNAPIPQPRHDGLAVAAVLATAAGTARRQRRRRLMIYAVLLAVAVAAALWWSSGETVTTYGSRPVTRGALTVTVTATGSLSPTHQVEISSELSGTIREVLVDYNSRVATGDVLARLDTERLAMAVDGAEAKLAAANAAVAEARATLAETAAELERKTTLRDRSVISSQEVETARAARARAAAGVDSTVAAVSSAETDLKLARLNVAKSSLLSPIDGIVLDRDVQPGQTVAASLSAPVLFTIAEDLARMELQVDVDEADVGRIAVGQSATFTVDAYPDRSFPAVIRSVRFASETVDNVVTYKAVLDVDNADLALRPGMTATADIVVEQLTDVLLVANAALRWAPPAVAAEAGGSFISRLMPRPPSSAAPAAAVTGPAVHVLRDGVPVAVPVTVKATDGSVTAVDGALTDGDAVILSSKTAD